MIFQTHKLLNPGKGYPCVFRNWRAASHCALWHGYDLMFAVTFACYSEKNLTEEGWVADFGQYGPLKERLDLFFDHKWIIAEDDPLLPLTKEYVGNAIIGGSKCADIVVMPRTGCEAFAQWLAVEATDLLQTMGRLGPVRVAKAQVFENNANAGSYQP